jgi:hypothetical protein
MSNFQARLGFLQLIGWFASWFDRHRVMPVFLRPKPIAQNG